MRFCCILLAITATACAQEGFGDNQPGKLTDDDRAAIGTAAQQAYQAVLARAARQEVESMRDHLKLSDAATKRLHLAAKGAVSAMAKGTGNFLAGIIERKLRGAAIQDVAIEGVPVVNPNKQRDNGEPPRECTCKVAIMVNRRQTWVNVTRANGGSGGSHGGRGFDAIWEQDVWTRTYEKSLSQKQRESYSAYREKLMRTHLAYMLTGTLALQLRLDIADREQLGDWVSKQVMSMDKLPLQYDPGQLMQAALPKLDFEKLRGTLSDDQIASLKSKSRSAGRSPFRLGF